MNKAHQRAETHLWNCTGHYVPVEVPGSSFAARDH